MDILSHNINSNINANDGATFIKNINENPFFCNAKKIFRVNMLKFNQKIVPIKLYRHSPTTLLKNIS